MSFLPLYLVKIYFTNLRIYESGIYKILVGLNANQTTSVKFSAHILVSGSGIINYVVYDLGGIIDLGIIPYGDCRNYSR